MNIRSQINFTFRIDIIVSSMLDFNKSIIIYKKGGKNKIMIIKLKEIREIKGLTQEKLAEMSGVSRQIIVALEKGNEVVTTTRTMINIANALGVNVTDIFLFWTSSIIDGNSNQVN